MKVRSLRAADIGAALALGEAMHAESPTWRERPFSPTKLRAFASQALGEPDWAVFMAWNQHDHPIGLMAGFVTEDWFGPGKFAADLALYVVPESRGSTAAIRLIFAFEGWAEQRGASEIRVGVSTGIRLEQADGFYRKAGFTPNGVMLRKRL